MLSKSIPQPSGDGVPSPSDKTLSKLDTRLNDLATCMEKQHNDKQQSKDKFEQLDDHVKSMILVASSESTEMSVAKPTDSLKTILDFSAATKSQSCLNQVLHLKKRKENVALTFVAFLIASDWIVRNSEEPEKMSLLFLGLNNDGER